MVFPGHLGSGYLMTRALLAIFHPALTATQTTALLIIGTLAGDLPDIDLALFSYTHFVKKSSAKAEHREYVTHMPLFWLLPTFVVVAIGAIAGSTFIECIGWLIWIGSWTHLLLDSIEYGVAWLWPFSRKRYALVYPPQGTSAYATGSFRYYWDFITRHYFRNITFYVEFLITAVALYVLFR